MGLQDASPCASLHQTIHIRSFLTAWKAAAWHVSWSTDKRQNSPISLSAHLSAYEACATRTATTCDTQVGHQFRASVASTAVHTYAVSTLAPLWRHAHGVCDKEYLPTYDWLLWSAFSILQLLHVSSLAIRHHGKQGSNDGRNSLLVSPSSLFFYKACGGYWDHHSPFRCHPLPCKYTKSECAPSEQANRILQ